MARGMSGFSILTGSVNFKLVTVASSQTPTFDLSLGNYFYFVFPAGNVTSATFSNRVTGKFFIIELVQDSVGGRTFAWPSQTKLAGGSLILTAAGGAMDMVAFICHSTALNIEVARALDVK